MARIVFMGTPDFAVPSLQALIDAHEVVGVVTQPDRPAGRKNQLRPSPVKQVALDHGLPVFQPEKIRRSESIEELAQWSDVDAYVVAAFGQILPQTVLDMPRYGSINVHASLLPRWRGAAPIQAVIRAGDTQTGITIMKMDAGLDTGPMLMARSIDIAPDETGASLHDKLAALGAPLLIEALAAYLSGDLAPQPQHDTAATYAPQIKKDEGRIDWQQDAAAIDRHVRAFTPWPGTFCDWQGETLKVISGAALDKSANAAPGQVVALDEGAGVVCGQGVYRLGSVQRPGRKPTLITDFLRGHPEFLGARLGGHPGGHAG